MSAVRNVLFIMCDQLRRDHLSCYGGRVHTPQNDVVLQGVGKAVFAGRAVKL